MTLTPQQQAFFETFGYLILPGLLAEDVGWITESFEELLGGVAERHDGTRRTITGTDQSERLCTLLDHPKVSGVAASLMGDDFNYLGGDANYYVGDTPWHSDGWHDVGLYVKMAFYLDPVTRETGCLRVIPGSHRVGDEWVQAVRKVNRPEENFGITGRDVPSVPLESRPGDVVVFNHNLHHAAYGGGNQRRMFTLNLCRRAGKSEEVQDLRAYINGHARFWIEHMHSDTLRRTATPTQRRHLEQVMANEDELPELSRQARAATAEPARG